MWAYTLATLRSSARSPVVWALLALAVGAGWLGIKVAVLALGETGQQADEIILTTAQAFGAVLALWVVARHLDEDGRAGFTSAADQSLPGPTGRILGRWLGAAISGSLAGATAHLVLSLSHGAPSADLLLYLAIIVAPILLATWGTVLGVRGGGGVAVAGGLALWVLGHLPWGSPALLPGPVGRALSAWLPGPATPSEALGVTGYTAAAVAGLLLLALALAPRPGARD